VTLTALHRDGTTVGFPNPASGKDVVVRDAQTATESFTNGVRRTVQNCADLADRHKPRRRRKRADPALHPRASSPTPIRSCRWNSRVA
jgi:hypothetical protein